MLRRTPTVVSFAERAQAETRQVGRVHESGAITFRGRTYRTIKEVPPRVRSLPGRPRDLRPVAAAVPCDPAAAAWAVVS